MANALFLGGPLHNEVMSVGDRHGFSAPLYDDRCRWLSPDAPVASMGRIRTVEYLRYRYVWSPGEEVAVFSCNPDENWMTDQLGGIHERMWFVNSRSPMRRVVLAKELTKMDLEFEQRLLQTEYAQATMRSRGALIMRLILEKMLHADAAMIAEHAKWS